MPRKRKIPLQKIVEANNDSEDEVDENENSENISVQHGPMYNIMSNVQQSETFHNKYIKEIQQLYRKMDHDAFMFTFSKMVKSAMEAEENNEYANTTLLFCAKYVSSYQGEVTHAVLLDIFKWITSTISNNPHIRYRLCQFVNIILRALGPEAALDDSICDSIMNYMITRLSDINPNVRVQAILALQRLQNPDNPDDIILKTYQFHLSSDPSPKVRMAVITSIGRNFNTIPYILERLWDMDEKVRRHTYLNMSSYPVRSYKVSQRLTFLEQGLNDRSEMVKKVVTSVMLPHWLESYNKDFIELISALKLDANEAEIERFRKTTKLALKEMFKKNNVQDLIDCLPIEKDDLENEFYKCVSHEKLNIEVSVYWICLIEYLQQEILDEIDMVIPELSTFCSYIIRFCELRKPTNNADDKWKKLENQYILLGLIEIVHTFDLGDETGRENLKQLISTLLKNYDINGEVVEMIVRCSENLISNQEDRLQFFVDIIKDITDTRIGNLNDFLNNRSLIDELLDKNSDINLKLKFNSLRVKILDLEEQERNYVDKKEYVKAQKITDEKSICHEEYLNLLRPLLNQVSNSENTDSIKSACLNLQQPKKVTNEDIIKCLQISFYMVASKKVSSLTPNVCELYKNFIRRHIESNTILVRNWALKCGTSYSMLYDQLAKDVYNELYSQFFKNINIRIWNTSIDCLFELIDRYGFDHFENNDKQNKNKNRRQLYNTLEFLDVEEDGSSNSSFHVDVMFMMSHILDTCEEVCILRAIIKGMCRLVLHGHIENDDIMEKLLLKYFNPSTEPEINQILGMFYRNLIKKKRQEYLQPCLLPTINTILTAPYDSPLHEIKPDSVIKFVIESTSPEFSNVGLNIHNTIALSFMQEMQNNLSNKELLKILSKEIFSLEVTASEDGLKADLTNCCEKLLESELDPKTAKNIKSFKDLLNGVYREGLRVREDASDEDEEESDHETQGTTETAPSIKAISVTNSSEIEINCDQNIVNIMNVENNKEMASEMQLETVPEENTNKESTFTTIEENHEKEIVINSANKSQNIANVLSNSESHSNTLIENSIALTKVKDVTQNITQDVSSIIPPFISDNSTPRKTISNENNEETPKVSKSPIKTPTTFGRENNTKMRYLRKSLNIHPISHDNEDGPTMPPKIRIEAKMQANVKGIQEVPQPANESPKIPHNEVSPKSNIENAYLSTRITSDKTPATSSKNNTLSVSAELSDDEVVAASPEAITNENGKRQSNRSRAKDPEPKLKAKTVANEALKNTLGNIQLTKPILRSSPRISKRHPNNNTSIPEKENGLNNSKTKRNNKPNQQTVLYQKNKPEEVQNITDSKTPTSKTKTLARISQDIINVSNKQNNSSVISKVMSTRSSTKKDKTAIISTTQQRNHNNTNILTKPKNSDKEIVSRIPISKSKTVMNKDKTSLQRQDTNNKIDLTNKNKNKQNENKQDEKTRRKINFNPSNKTSNLPVRTKSSRIATKK